MANKYEKSPAQASKFTAEEADFLKECVAKNMSSSEIARAMNAHNPNWPIRSRNSIIGFCHRMKYRLRSSPDAAQRVRSPRSVNTLSAEQRAERLKLSLKNVRPQLKNDLMKLQSIFDKDPVLPTNKAEGVPIFDAPTYGVCRFIVDDAPNAQKICCAPSMRKKDGSLGSWCEVHAAIVFERPSAAQVASRAKNLARVPKPMKMVNFWTKEKVSW